MGIFIGFIIFLAIIGVGAYFGLKFFLNKTYNSAEDISGEDDITETHQFIPFKNIDDSMIDMGDGQFRAIIECNSINYNLRTAAEKEIIEASYQRFLAGLKEPVTFYIQTRNINNAQVIENLKSNIEKSLQMYPNLENYANVYLEDMKNLSQIIGNNKTKHKYIIVSFNDVEMLSGLTEAEQYDAVAKELYQRCANILDSLSNVGIHGKILNTYELFELIYTCSHKDGNADIQNLLDGGFLTTIVSGNDRIESMLPTAQLDWILNETEMKLKAQLLDNVNVADQTKVKVSKAIEKIEQLRDEVAGYYKNH